jgi:hypothetical protein
MNLLVGVLGAVQEGVPAWPQSSGIYVSVCTAFRQRLLLQSAAYMAAARLRHNRSLLQQPCSYVGTFSLCLCAQVASAHTNPHRHSPGCTPRLMRSLHMQQYQDHLQALLTLCYCPALMACFLQVLAGACSQHGAAAISQDARA